jgi:hypothetical protein
MALWPAPVARSYWTWDASSGAKAEVANPPEGDSWFDLDSDGDSLTNAQEALFGSDPYQIDTDQDGLRDDAEQQLSDPTAPFDPWLWDSNSNGYSDHDELYQRLQGYVPVVHYPSLSSSGRPFFSYSDADGDGLKNHEDSDPLNMDRDSDGILNWNDTAYMDDANNGYIPPPPVSDPGVWIGGNWYPTGTLDSDNDGMPDPYDPFPWGSFWYSGIEYGGWWTDSDGDGIPNPADGFPNGSFWYNTTEYAGLWVDRDGDGIPDPADLWPTIAYSFWYNAQEYPGIWSDQDSDSIPDAADPFPNGSYWWNGREHSGAWVDSDYDSIPDAHDAHPNGSFWYNNIEYSGTWTDMDADGIPDPADPFPQGGSYWYNAVEYAGPWSDRDSDTIPDPADVTPDGGYWFNGTEYGGSWMDWDGDGVPDPADLWPHDRWNNEPHFNYNGTDYAGVWNDRDSDNVPDPADAYPDDPENNADTDGDGLSNYHERTQHGTDPTLRDTDGEGLTDSEELYTYHTNPLEQKTHPNQPYTDYYTVDQTDTDGDGVPDRIEQWYAQLGYAMGSGTTDDAKADFDGDGYSNVQAYRNGWSFIAHLNHYDHDQDGILDVLEDMWSVSYPGILSSSNFEDAVQDYDGDGLMNVEEVALGLNPGSAHSRSTMVHDWQEWAWRQSMGTKAAWQALEDANQDGVPEGLAAFVNDDNAGSSGITLPQRAAWGDYDGDGMPDVWEYRHHLHLRDASDAQGNPDGDSLTNLLEFQQNRDPWIQEDPPPPPLALGGHVPNGAVGEPYNATVAASGGTPGYSYSVSSGTLPDGLGLDRGSGAISGTPSAYGSFEFTLSVIDSMGSTAWTSCGLTIVDAGTTGGGTTGGGTTGGGGTSTPTGPLPVITLASRSNTVDFRYSPPTNSQESLYGASEEVRSQLLMADEGWEEVQLEPSAPEMSQLFPDDNGNQVPPVWCLVRVVGSGGFYTYDKKKFDSSGPETILSDEVIRTLIANEQSGPDITEHLEFQPEAPLKSGNQSSSDLSSDLGLEASRSSVSIGQSVFGKGCWREFWLKASAAVPEAVSRTYLIRKVSPYGGPPHITAVTLTIPKNGTYSTEGTNSAASDVNGTNGTLKLHPAEYESMSLLPIDIEEVISDQIAGNNANKLPTAYFKDEQNNPMLMATRSGQKAKLRVKMASASDPKIFVGARKNGTQAILGYASVTAAEVPLEIDVPANSHDIYEIVAGYDTNSNAKLDDSEVVTTFKKTPLKDASGGTVTDPQNLLDRVIIVDQGQFSSSKSTVIGYNYPGSEYAGNLIEGFARGRTTIPDATMVPSITVSSTQPGLGHPVGGKWNAANQDTTYRFTFADGSPASNDTEASNALKQIVQKVINDNKTAMISAYTGTPEWPVSPYYSFSEEKDFIKTDGEPEIFGVPLGIPELGASFGKVKITGQLRVSYKKTSATTIQVGSVEVIGSYDDLYDFAYGGGSRARQASMVQAGHATLAGTTEPNSGKVFFTRVEFNSGFANTWNGNY